MMLSSFVNGTDNSSLTIEWTLPITGNVMYAITVTPPPPSGNLMDTNSTQATITVLYNTQYNINISVTNVLCPGTFSGSFILG